jgi:drug/metabolite transporter (DMT)-like permease
MLMWTLALVWGASYLFIKLGLDGGIEPAFLVFVRLALAAAVLLPMARRAGALAGLRGRLPRLAALSAIQVAVPFLLITFGEERIPSSLTGILVATAPIFTALLVALGVGVEARLTVWAGAGIAIGLVGVALLFGVDLTGSGSAALGGAMVAAAGFGYAAGAIYLRRHFLDVPSVGVAAGSMAMSAVLTAPFAAISLPTAVPAAKGIAAVLVLGMVGTGVAFLIFYTLIATEGAAKASVVAYLAPGFALAYGALFLGEAITAGAIGGLVLILAGSWLAAAGRAPWRRSRAAAVPA